MSCDDNARTLTLGTKSAIWSSVQFVQPCKGRTFNTTAKVSDAVWDDHVILETAGYSLADIVVHAEGNNFSPNFTYRVVLQLSFENDTWIDGGGSPYVLVALQATGVYVPPAVFADRTKFGARIRVVVQTQVSAGSTKTEKGNLNIGVALRYLS